ncbi:carbon starvation protein A [Nibrella viscosa]|uniref:Carbon starvation protein A n=1 Tax=Nibrella viscosa TaxID=1084524 RepID=A0ABP8JZM4_9BACT
MITFCLSVLALFLGYTFYARFVDRVFGIEPDRTTPALAQADGVDYVALPGWRIFLIQFLNIAGLGPIFGAVAGAMWGPVAFLWIVLGSIFAGGVHDYFSGMLSVRHRGESMPEISGYYLGNGVKQFMRYFSVVLMIVVGAVFIMGPAKILAGLTGFGGDNFWVWIIFVYYVVATVLPIDKVIGRIYPLFGFALLFMAVGILVMMFANRLPIPELTISNLANLHTQPAKFPVFPMLFVTIACGAISGFHATQSPMMARCLTSERQGRSIFYGAMVTEGVVALIWAAIGMSFYGSVGGLNDVMTQHQGNAAFVVNEISNSLLGKIGGALAILGVVAAPITSGDTAFRSARLIVADFLRYQQGPIQNRLLLSLPLFGAGFLLTLIDFAVIWRYFAWTNQTLATVVLWTITAYLIRERKPYWVGLVPAVFMTAVITAYLLVAPEGFGLPVTIAYLAGVGLAAVLLGYTWLYAERSRKSSTLVPQA